MITKSGVAPATTTRIRRPSRAVPTRYGVEEVKTKLDTVYPILDTRLRDMPWMAGESFTLAIIEIPRM